MRSPHRTFSLVVFLFAFGIASTVLAETLLFVDFEDPSAFTLGGGYAQYWGIAPLSGTPTLPSYFVQGGSQSGNIFFGVYAKQYIGSPAPTMTIALPDLTGYTNIRLKVALAAPDGSRWENTHRDSLHILGATTTTPPFVDCSISPGCMPVTGAIDNFLPAGYGAPLRSQVWSIDLHPQFQDFEYSIDNSLKSVTFAFASTDWDEVAGIDSVRITGDPVLDADGDGVPDGIDACPDSVLTPTVIIDSCDSGVPNEVLNTGCSYSDLIGQLAQDAKNHGQFVSGVSSFTNELMESGAISPAQKDATQSCAAKAKIP